MLFKYQLNLMVCGVMSVLIKYTVIPFYPADYALLLQENFYWLDRILRSYQSRIYSGDVGASFQVAVICVDLKPFLIQWCKWFLVILIGDILSSSHERTFRVWGMKLMLLMLSLWKNCSCMEILIYVFLMLNCCTVLLNNLKTLQFTNMRARNWYCSLDSQHITALN